jgi:hypothetical protein
VSETLVPPLCGPCRAARIIPHRSGPGPPSRCFSYRHASIQPPPSPASPCLLFKRRRPPCPRPLFPPPPSVLFCTRPREQHPLLSPPLVHVGDRATVAPHYIRTATVAVPPPTVGPRPCATYSDSRHRLTPPFLLRAAGPHLHHRKPPELPSHH